MANVLKKRSSPKDKSKQQGNEDKENVSPINDKDKFHNKSINMYSLGFKVRIFVTILIAVMTWWITTHCTSSANSNDMKNFEKRLKDRWPLDIATDGSNVVNIHIGKTGGSAFLRHVHKVYPKRTEVHVPIFNEERIANMVAQCSEKYFIFWIRDPIHRIVSAWNYNFYKQKYNLDILKKYQSIQNISNSLYKRDSNEKTPSQIDLEKIEHIRHGNYGYYTQNGTLIEKCSERIIFVGVQEHFAHDLELFGNLTGFTFANEPVNYHKGKYDDKLDGQGLLNMRRFCEMDYKFIESLIRRDLVSYEKVKHYNWPTQMPQIKKKY